MPPDLNYFSYFMYVLYIPLVLFGMCFLSAKVMILAVFIYKLILSFIMIEYVGMFPFYSGDSSHFIAMVDYLVHLHSDGQYASFSIVNMNSVGLTAGLANGTSYAAWGALLSIILGFDAPVSLLVVSQFSSLIVSLNIYFISKRLDLDARFPLLIYFLMPLSVMYSLYILKDAYVSAIFTSLFYVVIFMRANIFRFLAIILLILLLLFDRWYMLVFFFAAYLFSISKMQFIIRNIAFTVMALSVTIYLVDLFGYPISIVLGGYGSDQVGFLGDLSILLKLVIMPLLMWKSVLSPNLFALLGNQSLPYSEIYSIFYVPQVIFALMFGVILLFWFRNFKFVFGLPVTNYFKNYPDLLVLNRFVFFFLFTLSLYTTSHGRVREAIMPLLIITVLHFFVKARKRFI